MDHNFAQVKSGKTQLPVKIEQNFENIEKVDCIKVITMGFLLPKLQMEF